MVMIMKIVILETMFHHTVRKFLDMLTTNTVRHINMFTTEILESTLMNKTYLIVIKEDIISVFILKDNGRTSMVVMPHLLRK